MHFDLENFEFDEEWLREAARIEEGAGCDIQAGFDWGSGLGDYVVSAKSFINQEKLMTVLQEGLGDILSQEDLEAIAGSFQNQARGRVIEKFQSAQSA